MAALTTTGLAQVNPNPQNVPIRVINPDPVQPPQPAVVWHPDGPHDADWRELPNIDLNNVPPAPMGQPGPRMPNLVSSDTIMVYDSDTGHLMELPLGTADTLPKKSEIPYMGPGNANMGDEMSRWGGTLSAVSSGTLTTFPARANVRLLMRFVTNTGADAYFVCSGSMQDGGVVLTAAHCVFNRDSNINDWASEIWVFPAWDGSGASPPSATTITEKYGWARGHYYIAGSGYVNSGDWDRDCAAIRLNRADTRSVGMLTGWYGWSVGYCDTGVTHYNYSYPAEDCSATLHTGRQMYFWSSQPDGCPGLFDNQLDLDTSGGCFGAVWGGMSGSAMYRFIGSDRFVVATCSTSNRSSSAHYCCLWDQFTTDLDAFKSETRGSTFDIEALNYHIVSGSTTVEQGNQIPAGQVLISNTTNNNPASRTVTIGVYLSTNTDISTGDTLLATYNYTVDFGAMDSITFNVPAVTIPYTVPPGNYYAGIIIDAGEDSNPNNNDTDTWDAQPITVTCNALTAPTGFTGSNGVYCGYVALDWAAVTGASQYFVYRSTTNNSATASLLTTTTATAYNDTTASSSGTLYYYWVKADSNCSTSGFSAVADGYRQTAVGTPTGVNASDGTACGTVSVSWNSVSNADTYYIYRNTTNSTSGVTYLGSDTLSPFVDNPPVDGTTYYYFVRAGNDCGIGSFSAGNAGYASEALTAPTGVAASDGASCSAVNVSWVSNAHADSYTIWRNTTNASGTAAQIGSTIGAGNVNYADGTAVAGQVYYYWVRAVNECGTSGFSASNSGYRRTAPLLAPTGLVASDGSAGCTTAVSLTWNASVNTDSYKIFRNSTNNSATATQIGTSAVNAYDDATAAPNTTYFYWVKASNACGDGAFSASDSGNRGSAPAAPTGVSASDNRNCNSVSVSWSAVTAATNYRIYRNTTNNSATAVQIGTDNASPYLDNTTVGSNVYFYWVRAENSCGTSGFSNSNSGFAGTSVVIDTQPADLTVYEGQQAQFTIDVGGASTYRWRKNNVDMSNNANVTGVTTATLTILSASQSDEANYSCFVTSPCGSVLSNTARLTVDAAPCPADYNQDGGIDGADVQAFYADWEGGLPQADVNFDGGIDGADVEYFFAVWEAGGCF